MHQTEDRWLRSYVFVTTAPGTTRTAVREISELELPGCRILTVEQVIGGCDIIAMIETPDIDSLAHAISDGIRVVPGVLDAVASRCSDRCDLAQPKPLRPPGDVDVISLTGY